LGTVVLACVVLGWWCVAMETVVLACVVLGW